jgi:hypothetical protein
MNSVFELRVGDILPPIGVTLTPLASTLAGATVRFKMVPEDAGVAGPSIDAVATVTDVVAGTVRYNWVAGQTAVAGTYRARFVVTYGDGSVETFPSSGCIFVRIS